MKNNTNTGKTVIKPEQLIGTKWISWSELFADRMSVEFIDNTNCIYTSQPKRFPLKYNIEKGELFISNIEGAFELRGNVLFNQDLPVFEKAA